MKLLFVSIAFILIFAQFKALYADYEYTQFHKTHQISHLETAWATDPHSTHYNYWMAFEALKAKDGPKALKYIHRVRDYWNGDLVLWAIADFEAKAWLSVGQMNHAYDLAQEALRYNPDFKPSQDLVEKIQEYRNKKALQ